MAKGLVIVESPAKAKTIQKYLGKDFTVEASLGHVKDLPKSILGVDPGNDFETDYVVIPGKEKVLIRLKKLAESADSIYLAPDPMAIWTKRAISPSDRLPQPSAKFAAIEADARRTWLVSPNRSSLGNTSVIL